MTTALIAGSVFGSMVGTGTLDDLVGFASAVVLALLAPLICKKPPHG